MPWDPPLCCAAVQRQHGGSIRGLPASQGVAPQGVSSMAQTKSRCGLNMTKLGLPSAGVARHDPCVHVASHMHMADRIGHTDVPARRRRQTPRSSIGVGTTTTRRQVKRTMLEHRFWVQ